VAVTLSSEKVLPVESNSELVESGCVDSSLQKAISKARIGSRDAVAPQLAFESPNDLRFPLLV